jgi:hypothetical protein
VACVTGAPPGRQAERHLLLSNAIHLIDNHGTLGLRILVVHLGVPELQRDPSVCFLCGLV